MASAGNLITALAILLALNSNLLRYPLSRPGGHPLSLAHPSGATRGEEKGGKTGDGYPLVALNSRKCEVRRAFHPSANAKSASDDAFTVIADEKSVMHDVQSAIVAALNDSDDALSVDGGGHRR